MTFTAKGYKVTIIAEHPDLDSFTATKLFMQDFEIMLREAAESNQRKGYRFAADDYKNVANNIHEALLILGDDNARG